MYFSCLLCSKEAISCFHLWNNPFLRHNHCFKSLQFVSVCTFYPFDNVTLYPLQLAWWADQKPEAISDEGSLHQRKMQKREQGTVLLPGVSIPTVTTLSRVGCSTGRTGTELCVLSSHERDGWSHSLELMIRVTVISSCQWPKRLCLLRSLLWMPVAGQSRI